MLSGVLKFSHKTPLNDVCASAGGDAVFTGCIPDPVARMSQTPATKTRMRTKYGK